MKRFFRACFPKFAGMAGKAMLIEMAAATAGAMATSLSQTIHAQTMKIGSPGNTFFAR